MDTPPLAQQKAREEFDEASRELAAASVRLKDAEAHYDLCRTRYALAFGAAKQAGVLK